MQCCNFGKTRSATTLKTLLIQCKSLPDMTKFDWQMVDLSQTDSVRVSDKLKLIFWEI